MNDSLPMGFQDKTWTGTITETGPKGGQSTFFVTITFSQGNRGDIVGDSEIQLQSGSNGCQRAVYRLQLVEVLQSDCIRADSVKHSSTGDCNPAENDFKLLSGGRLEVEWWIDRGNTRQERHGKGILT